MAKILVAMSGGVDSSAAAALLKEQGHEVEGAYMKNWINEDNILGDCPWQQDIDDARSVADVLGIPFRVVNLMAEYKERVVRYLLEGYQAGVTPNPDVMCNREMKFGVFLAWARDQGFEGLATGHYVRNARDAQDRPAIRRGLDPLKDQSYFLAMLQADQVAQAWFPVGDILKTSVREVARRFDLPVATKRDSQGICFIGKVRMQDFLRAYLPDDPGPIITLEGKVVGQHKGLHLFTLGQRKGLGVPSNQFGEAFVVVAKRAADKALLVAFDHPETPGLYSTTWRISSLSWCGDAVGSVTDLQAQARYRTPAVSARLHPVDETNAVLDFAKPQRAISPGQVCAFYEGDRLLGGGIFADTE